MSTQQTSLVSAEFMAYMAKVAGKPGSEEDNLMSIDEDEEHKPTYDKFMMTGKLDPTVVENEYTFFKYLAENNKPSAGDYDDSHVYLSANARTLTLKHWLISHPILVIDVDKILYLRPAPDVVFDDFGVKVWGIGETGVGWDRDANRKGASGPAYQHSYVCKYTDERLGLRAGFTVDDTAKFVEALERVAPGITSRHTYP
ncbi:hypothetical protein CALCODRAFT_504649 [Calocera cornea HHB12733]|uniref:Uncharacterized protein n=1 Tax=Calocera cornea HHB12733 TaxID=1353952 RepID=A0A165CAD2_9BASI|nr:hypothetical protein CALCODRAFT_504649 [Calocera cornea HHB12733]